MSDLYLRSDSDKPQILSLRSQEDKTIFDKAIDVIRVIYQRFLGGE